MSSMIGRYLREDKTCRLCDGRGEILAPVWELYFIGHKYNDAIDEEWFRNAGYGSTIPPQNIQCPECSGTGTVSQEITVDEYIDGVMDHISRIEFTIKVLSSELKNLRLEINSLRNV